VGVEAAEPPGALVRHDDEHLPEAPRGDAAVHEVLDVGVRPLPVHPDFVGVADAVEEVEDRVTLLRRLRVTRRQVHRDPAVGRLAGDIAGTGKGACAIAAGNRARRVLARTRQIPYPGMLSAGRGSRSGTAPARGRQPSRNGFRGPRGTDATLPFPGLPWAPA